MFSSNINKDYNLAYPNYIVEKLLDLGYEFDLLIIEY